MLAACSSPAARVVDAAIDDAPVASTDAALCGNGTLDQAEQCDDGARNGTTASRCTRQCFKGIYQNVGVIKASRLPGHSIHDLVDVHLNGSEHVVIRDTASVFLAFGLSDVSVGANYVPVMIELHGAAAPTSLGRFEMRDQFTSAPMTWSFPLWIEAPSASTGGNQGLYWAYLDANNQPVVRSLPYPFPDGAGGTLLTPSGSRPIIVDQSTAPPYDLLIAVVLPRSESDIGFSTARLPSHGLQRGVLAGTRYVEDLVEDRSANPPAPVHRILQFFSDTHQFSLVDVRQPYGDAWGVTMPFPITELFSGEWPFDVAGAADWRERAADDTTVTAAAYADLTHPNPFAIINADGAVYTWQFNQAFDSSQEGFAVPFAHVPAGTRVACAFFDERMAILWALAPDGRAFFLNDGDSADVHSSSLESDVHPAAPPWSTAAVPPTFDETNALGCGSIATHETRSIPAC